jgi:hypothetical protein
MRYRYLTRHPIIFDEAGLGSSCAATYAFVVRLVVLFLRTDEMLEAA